MDIRYKTHNLHWDQPDKFRELDPHLSNLSQLPLIYRFPLLEKLPRETPGVYSITGGRQVGKTTLLKQYMSDLLQSGVSPGTIAYLPGEMIDDHHGLVRLFSEFLESVGPETGPLFFLLDEVTYINQWDRGIKYLADAGLLRNTILMLTGSDTVIIRDARVRFPGRRGRADRVDFHLFPLSFAEYVSLDKGMSHMEVQHMGESSTSPRELSGLEQLFESYLAHGGYLTAINDLKRYGTINRATFVTYGDWIRGDVLKRGKREHYLREILTTIVKRMGSQVTWNGLSDELSIDHPATVADYVELLARMDAAIIQLALREDKLTGAPKKARKIHFADPFIFHAVRSWLNNTENPYQQEVRPFLDDAEKRGALVESCAVSHFNRFYPTYYIKGTGEVDIAYVRDDRFWPIEVKWTRQLRAADFKQASKYPDSIICSRADQPPQVHGITCRPLVTTLLRLGPSPLYLPGS
ncbi:MAG: ATP-binding protein [Phycisphaerae bacterium]|jgi:hypothetical protein|nr:ATP-binding protein [Phycisphaerae bacterium]